MKPDKYGRTIPDELRPYVDIADRLFSEHGLAHPIEVARAFLEAEQRGRREGMEEAAKVADSYANDSGDKAARGYFTETERASRSTGRSIAAAIRAKMEDQP